MNVEHAEGLDEQFLEQVLGFGFLPGQPKSETPQPVEVRLHKFFERYVSCFIAHTVSDSSMSRAAAAWTESANSGQNSNAGLLLAFRKIASCSAVRRSNSDCMARKRGSSRIAS